MAPIANKERVSVRALASAAAVERQDATGARVLVFLNQEVTVDRLDQPRIDRNRVEATVRKVGDCWFVVGVTAL